MIYLCTNRGDKGLDGLVLSHFYIHKGEYFCLQEKIHLNSLLHWKIESNTYTRFIDIDDVGVNMVLPLIYNYVQIDSHRIFDDLDSFVYKIVLNNI